MQVRCWFDGGCGPNNPGGHAAYGCVVQINGKSVFLHSGYVGYGRQMSNNVAEYSGIIEIFKYLLREDITEAIVFGDSLIVVDQLNGRMKARRGLYIEYYREALKLRQKLPHVEIRHIRREYNTQADYLAGLAIKDHCRPRQQKRKSKELVKLVKAQRADARGRYLKFEHAINK